MISLVAGPIAAVVRPFDQLRQGAEELMSGFENFNKTMDNLNETAERQPAAQRVRGADAGHAPPGPAHRAAADDISIRLSGPIEQVVPGLDRLA